jgi:hypothetical protein
VSTCFFRVAPQIEHQHPMRILTILMILVRVDASRRWYHPRNRSTEVYGLGIWCYRNTNVAAQSSSHPTTRTTRSTNFGGRLNFRQLADGAAEPQTGASRQGRLLAKKEELCLDCVGHTGNKGGQTACQLFTNADSDGL